MIIKITGASGYIGTSLTQKLVEQGHEVSGINRRFLYGDPQDLAQEIAEADIIINLAGASIAQRWTKKSRKKIYDSRIITTRTLVSAINLLETKRPSQVISASAIGIYKPNFMHDESSTSYADNFVGEVVSGWEHEIKKLDRSIPLSILRIGLVIGEHAKTIKNLKTATNLGLGSTIAGGQQPFPYIHIGDVCAIVNELIDGSLPNNTYNLVAPESINFRYFLNAMAKELKRPAFLNTPGWLVRLGMGEASALLTESPGVIPRNLINSGYNFRYKDIRDALSEIL